MKKLLFVLLFAMAALASCKKDSTTPPVDPPPIDPLVTNTGLIASGAQYYLIADVTGIPGVTKINWQASTVAGSKTTAYNGLCNTNECHTGYIVGHDVQPNYFWFAILFQNNGPEGFTNMVHTGDFAFCTPSNRVNGMDISFTDANYEEWRCVYVDNNTIAGSSFKVTKYETVGGKLTLEAQFNCTLKNSAGATITLSNAVFKAHWE